MTRICLSLAWTICVSSNSLACSMLLTLQSWQVFWRPVHLPRNKGTSSKNFLFFTSTNRSPWVHGARPERGVASCPRHSCHGLSIRTSKGYGIFTSETQTTSRSSRCSGGFCKLYGWEFVLCIPGRPCESAFTSWTYAPSLPTSLCLLRKVWNLVLYRNKGPNAKNEFLRKQIHQIM